MHFLLEDIHNYNTKVNLHLINIMYHTALVLDACDWVFEDAETESEDTMMMYLFRCYKKPDDLLELRYYDEMNRNRES